MKIKLVKFPYEDYEVGEVIDLGEEKNASLVEFQRAVWVEEEEKKKTPKKKVPKTTTLTEDSTSEEDAPLARGADGRFVSKKEETEEPKKKGVSG
jgi:hypothetical protein